MRCAVQAPEEMTTVGDEKSGWRKIDVLRTRDESPQRMEKVRSETRKAAANFSLKHLKFSVTATIIFPEEQERKRLV